MRHLKGFVAAAAAAWALCGNASAAPTIDLLTDMAFTNGAAGATEVQPILITSDTAVSTANGVRLIIPATYSMTWSTDTSVEVLISGTGAVSSTVSTYTNSDKTCVLNVTTPLDNTTRLTVSGLEFTAWSAEETADILGISVDGTNTAVASSNQVMTTGGVKLSSANHFSFSTASTTPTLPDITITESGALGAGNTITAASDIRLVIRNTAAFGTAPQWDTTMTSVTLTNPATGVVSGTLTGGSFQNSDRTLILNVTTTFAASEAVVISGLRFATPGAAYTADSLELCINGTNAPNGSTDILAVDDKSFCIGPPNLTMGSVNTVAASAAAAGPGEISITDTAGSAITAASDVRLVILSTTSTAGTSTGRDNLSWDVGVTPTLTQPSTGVVATGAMAVTDTGNGGGKRLAFLNVTTGFAAGDALKVNGIQVSNATATATKLYIGLVLQSFTASTSSAAYGYIASMVTEQNVMGTASTETSSGSSSGGCFLRAAECGAAQ